MNKRGEFIDFVVSWIPKIIAISIIFLAVVFYVNRFVLTKLDVQDIEASLVVDRLMYSKTCLSYVDNELSRPYPGIIDLEKFNTETTDSCIYYGEDEDGNLKNKYTSAKLTLTYTEEGTEKTKTIYHNKDWYENWFPLVGISGPSGVLSHKETNYVLVKKDEELLQGKLDFDVILPNS
jgi:hypothetical protein